MNLSAPTMPVFPVSLIVAVLTIAGTQVNIPVASGNTFWVAILAYVSLLVGNVAKDL